MPEKYAIIKLKKFKVRNFEDIKKTATKTNYIVTSSSDSMLESLDGTLGIIKWKGEKHSDLDEHIIETFDSSEEMRSFLEKNADVWFESKAEAEKEPGIFKKAINWILGLFGK